MPETENRIKQLPSAETIQGMYYNPQTMMVQIQYRSANQLYEIAMPLAEVLKMEEWFIRLRQSIGASIQRP